MVLISDQGFLRDLAGSAREGFHIKPAVRLRFNQSVVDDARRR